MAEPIPSASNVADDENATKLPDNAEDRKAAAALNSLNATEMSQDNGDAATKQPSAAAQEALGKAMSRLEIASGAPKKEDKSKKTDVKRETEVKKKIKIASEDVTFLVDQLDLSKNRATELLRTHDGNADIAIKAFIAPSIKA